MSEWRHGQRSRRNPTETKLCVQHTCPLRNSRRKLVRVLTWLIPGARNSHAVELHVGVRARVCVYVHGCVHVNVCACACTCECVRVCSCMCLCVHVPVCARVVFSIAIHGRQGLHNRLQRRNALGLYCTKNDCKKKIKLSSFTTNPRETAAACHVPKVQSVLSLAPLLNLVLNRVI